MDEPLIDTNRDIERIIYEAKQTGFGYIMTDTLNSNAFNRIYKEKMLNYGLIKIDSEKPHMYHLTERGWSFKSFADEDEQEEYKRRLLKINVQNSERINQTYWVTFALAIIGSLISIFLLILKLTEPKAPIH
jgi:hypothetical protein